MRKILFYLLNARTLLRVISLQSKISAGGGQSAIILLRHSQLGRAKLVQADVHRCIGAALRVGASFGLLNSCLTRATIECLLLRSSGIDARTAFGLNKNGGILEGHCWLVLDGTPAPDQHCIPEYNDVMMFP